MVDVVQIKKNAVCNTCTRRLVTIAYQRAPLFRLVRQPLKLAMRSWVRLYHLHPEDYRVNAPGCYNCMRFYKTALKERSWLFRQMNGFINPVFDAILERIVSREEVKKAEAHAQAATAGQALPDNGEEYTRTRLWPKI